MPPENTMIINGRTQKRNTFGHWQVGGCCYVCVGKSWRIMKSQNDDLPRLKLREITRRMMAEISDLVDQAKEAAAADHIPVDKGSQVPRSLDSQNFV